MIASNEYFLKQRDPNGLATNAQWLTSLYTRLLARQPDSAGFNANLNTILNGYHLQRQLDSNAIIASAEYLSNVVRGLYQTYLRRQPTPGELAVGLASLQNGGTNEQIIITLISSTEYFQNVKLDNGDQ